MNPPLLHVLIAENQYLIAMEVERILKETVPCDVTITPLSGLGRALDLTHFDIVIVEATAATAPNIERAAAIRKSGAIPVFLSSYDQIHNAESGMPAHLVVHKPLIQDELSGAIGQVAAQLAARPAHSTGEGLLDDG